MKKYEYKTIVIKLKGQGLYGPQKAGGVDHLEHTGEEGLAVY